MASVALDEEEKTVEVAPAPAPASPKLVLEIDVSDATIGDMQAIDRIASNEPGAFAAGVDVLAGFVTNIDIRTRPRREFQPIAKAVMAQFRGDAQGN